MSGEVTRVNSAGCDSPYSGGCGAWPEAGQACSGFLLDHDGYRLLIDAGYATMPRLLAQITADQVDTVFISHGHPGHLMLTHLWPGTDRAAARTAAGEAYPGTTTIAEAGSTVSL